MHPGDTSLPHEGMDDELSDSKHCKTQPVNLEYFIWGNQIQLIQSN